MDITGHFRTITEHKTEVMKNCFRAGIYRQGLMHDLSKYSPVEFIRGAVYYQGNCSPNTAERRINGVSMAWLHHKGRNKHHLEYWIDYSLGENGNMAGMKMPVRYVVEMACDRIAASKVYMKEKYTDRAPLDYYNNSVKHYIIHPESSKLLCELLTMLAEKGEDATFKYMKEELIIKDRCMRREKNMRQYADVCDRVLEEVSGELKRGGRVIKKLCSR